MSAIEDIKKYTSQKEKEIEQYKRIKLKEFYDRLSPRQQEKFNLVLKGGIKEVKQKDLINAIQLCTINTRYRTLTQD